MNNRLMVNTIFSKKNGFYENKSDAIESFNNFKDVNEHPTGNWLKRKGEGGDLRNPNYILENEL